MMSRRRETVASASRVITARPVGSGVGPRSRTDYSTGSLEDPRLGRSASAEGTILPLGATWVEDERAYNFSLYAQHAESVVVLLFKEVFFPPEFDREAAQRPGSNLGQAPLGVLPRRRSGLAPEQDWPPRHASDAVVIYENLHVDSDPRKPPLLGYRNACRRLPVRPGLGAGPRPGRLIRDRRLLAPGRDPHRPDSASCPPDRRAVGCRLGLPARDQVSRTGVVSVERPVWR